MKNLIIIGTGAVSSELTSYISTMEHSYNIIGYVEYEQNIENHYKKYKYEKPVIGSLDDSLPIDNCEYLLAFSNIEFKNKVIEIIKEKKLKIGTFIHDTSILDKNIKIGEGNIIYPFCVVGPNVEIGNYNLITSYSAISHDSRVGDNNFMATTILCGNTIVGNNNFFGIRSTTIPHIKIGNNNTFSAGSIISKNISDEYIYFGKKNSKIIKKEIIK
jgi:sugar O-acyltransferase (sialic acid O-acetyltransferase NeuD family)